MSVARVVQNGFKKFFTTSGRCRRSDFWLWLLLVAIALGAAAVVQSLLQLDTGNLTLVMIVGAFLTIPTLTYMGRRLHDLPLPRKSTWLALILLPVIGVLILLFWCAQAGHYGPNRYGRDPMDVD